MGKFKIQEEVSLKRCGACRGAEKKKEMKGFKWFSDPRSRKTEQCQYTSLLPHELMKMVIRIWHSTNRMHHKDVTSYINKKKIEKYECYLKWTSVTSNQVKVSPNSMSLAMPLPSKDPWVDSFFPKSSWDLT